MVYFKLGRNMREILFCQWHKLLGKKFRVPPTGVEPMTFCTPVGCSTTELQETRGSLGITVTVLFLCYKQGDSGAKGPAGSAGRPGRTVSRYGICCTVIQEIILNFYSEYSKCQLINYTCLAAPRLRYRLPWSNRRLCWNYLT